MSSAPTEVSGGWRGRSLVSRFVQASNFIYLLGKNIIFLHFSFRARWMHLNATVINVSETLIFHRKILLRSFFYSAYQSVTECPLIWTAPSGGNTSVNVHCLFHLFRQVVVVSWHVSWWILICHKLELEGSLKKWKKKVWNGELEPTCCKK